jgi:PilZ domain
MKTDKRTELNKADRRKHPRFIKRLETKLIADHKSFWSISNDLSEGGLFIKMNGDVYIETPLDIELSLPDNVVSVLKGVVRRTMETPVSTEYGMGVEIIEKDINYINYLKSLVGERKKNEEYSAISGSQIVSSSTIEGIDKGLKDDIGDKRQNKRYIVDERNLNVQIALAKEVKVIDISIGGISFKTDKKLDPGKQYILKLHMKDRVINVHGVVKWSSLSEYKKYRVQGEHGLFFDGRLMPIYTVGMQLIDISGDKLEKFIQLLDGLAKIDTDSERIYHEQEFFDLSEYVLSENAETTESSETASRQNETISDPERIKSIAEKIKSACSCGIEERSVFLRDQNREVLLAVLENPKITTIEIEKLAKLHTIPEEAIKKIIKKRAWMKHDGIVSALVNNPKTPPYIAVTLVKKLKKKDLKILKRNIEVSDAVRSAAKKLL